MTQEETMIMALSERVNSLAEHVLCIWAKVDALEKRAGIYTDTYKGTSITAEHEPTFDNAHHCGQDADENQPEGFSYKDLIDRKVIGIGRMASSCTNCGEADCVKVELVGGTCMCLARPQQDERPVISFDEGTVQEDTPTNIMDIIGEETKKFLDFLDGVVKSQE